MGRKTFESLGKPLPNRLNIVVTRNTKPERCSNLILNRSNQVKFCFSLENAINKAKKFEQINNPHNGEVFIIGGGEIYHQVLPLAAKLYLTLVDADCPEADTFFPDYNEFKKVIFKEVHGDGEYKYTFLELVK